jgi:hypothetical protein
VLHVRQGYAARSHFPGGGVGIGETGELTARRQLRAAACAANSFAPLLHRVFFNRHASRSDHVAVYLIDLCTQSG